MTVALRQGVSCCFVGMHWFFSRLIYMDFTKEYPLTLRKRPLIILVAFAVWRGMINQSIMVNMLLVLQYGHTLRVE